MVIAARGWPGWRLVLADLRRRLARRVGRQRHQLLVRPRHRPRAWAAPGHVRFRPGASNRGQALAFGIAPRGRVLRAARDDGEPALGRAGDDRAALLRPRLHDVAEAVVDAEHRHRRRGGRDPAARRLGGGDRAASTSPRCSSSRWSSTGPRRTSGRSRCSSRATTRAPGCRCSRWSRATARPATRSCCTRSCSAW